MNFLLTDVNTLTFDAGQRILCESCYNYQMAGKSKKKKAVRPVFDSIRKPTAPPSIKLGSEKPDEKSLPSLRKAKHKQKIDPEEQ